VRHVDSPGDPDSAVDYCTSTCSPYRAVPLDSYPAVQAHGFQPGELRGIESI
jgi:hypothetical protein